MDDGVLHKGLEHEVRHHGIQTVFGYVKLYVQAVSKPGLLNIEVGPDEFYLLPQGDFRNLSAVDSNPKQLAKAGHHSVSRLGIRVNQGGHGVERVEKEMRLELPLQGL